ncbi:MAG: alpha/beta hydrolase [Cardiobacteriaceae bacterium]|nr:alpha/beta hydrolase [Cardiobacteriaceae bacterium]
MFHQNQGNRLIHRDAQIYYEMHGDAHKPALLLLHGGGGSMEDFSPLASWLTQYFYIVAIDSRGHGRSTLGEVPLSYAQLTEDAQCVLKQLGISSYSVFGFSDGGTVAYRLAVDNPQVESLITLGAGWCVDDSPETVALFHQIDSNFWQANNPKMCERYQVLNPEADLDRLLKMLVSMWLDSSEKGYPNTKVAKIAVPVLVMRGEADFLYSLSDALDLCHLLPQAHFANLPFAQHEAIVEQPQLVQAAIMAMLSTLRSNT